MPLSMVRQALRRLFSSSGFSSTVIFTLGIGIGATVAVFSIIYSVLIRPLPYPDPSNLVSVFQSKIANDEGDLNPFSPADFLEFRKRNQTLTDLAASCGFHYNLTGRGLPRHLNGEAASAGLFAIMGVKPALGRMFLPDEDNYSAPHVVLLSHDLWSREFNRDPQIVGTSIFLNGAPYQVVGVMASSFRSPDGEQRDLWVPLQQQIRPDRMAVRDLRYLTVVGRLRSGVTLNQARADLNRISVHLRSENPTTELLSGAVLMPLQEAQARGVKRSLTLSLGVVVLVLLIASSNVAILMLVRVTGRMREFAVRIALGANARHILSEVFAESLILAILSGFVGVLLAFAARRLFLNIAPQRDVFASIQINHWVLAFAFAISMLVGFGFGLFPALRLLKTDFQRILRSGGSATTMDPSGRNLRHYLVTAQISLSILLLVGTGLLLHSLASLQRLPLGFRSSRVMTSWIGLPRIHYQNNTEVANFFARVDENMRGSPSIEAVGLGYPLPLQGNHFWTNFTIEGRNASAGEYESASLRFIDSGFLRVMEIPILQGRNFTDADDAEALPVTIVSESFAHKYWPGEDPLGKYITIRRDNSVPRRVVGIVRDVRSSIEDEPPPTMYVSFKQMSFPSMQLVYLARDGDGLSQVRTAVQKVDPDQPVMGVASMESIVHEVLEPWRFSLSILGGLTVLAVGLTMVGLFAVISYTVRERTKDLGVRLAVGASRGHVIALVLKQSLELAIVGTVLGLILTFAVVHFMTAMVYGIHPNDPTTILAVVCLVAILSVGAALIPALRAARIEPLKALREE